jgi:hypothetical protein
MRNVIADEVVVKSKPKRQLLAELDQRITHELGQLLKSAHPSREKIHQLAKLLSREVDDRDFETIKRQVLAYYSCPFERRTAGQFMRTFGIKPYPWLHSQFLLNFCNAHVSETKIAKLAGTLRHYFLLTIEPPKEVAQTDFLHLTLFKLLHPRPEEKKSGFRLGDFIDCWDQTARSKWGDKFNNYFESLAEDADVEYGAPISNPPIGRGSEAHDQANDLEFTQTDLDWMKEILEAIASQRPPPQYPLSRGPNQPATRQLEKVVRAIIKLKNGPKVILLSKAARELCTGYLDLYGQS